ncbi:general secretion pathway protein GspK [Nitrosococcus wardiae]|uniref:General secretion pathway protein GspK n=1 Tax=Nitrosococcus wardiae TaxID=1814290 RepID=A0A4P7BUD8_9GAMM|nr:type II secretion system protein GspK [Nitrosococcus wardiae]QBQ53538.1 general secretion pathway protein GspK [Nitrosococcus wardiae]
MSFAERGIALVVVLWTVTLLAVIAGSFTYTLRIESTLAANLVGQAKARALAEAGIVYATLDLLRPLQMRRFSPDGLPYRWKFGDGEVMISVRDVGGLVDLNTASRELLGGLLGVAGVAVEERDSLLDAIEDWRDPDDVPLLQGAEDKDYMAAGLPYGAKDGPFEDITELQQVLGISLELYQRLENFLTVYSEQPGIDPAVAPRGVLLAIPGIDFEAIEIYLEERRARQMMGEAPPPLPPVGGGYLAQAQGLAYSVRAEAKTEGGGAALIKAVISPDSSTEGLIPYSVLEWRESL